MPNDVNFLEIYALGRRVFIIVAGDMKRNLHCNNIGQSLLYRHFVMYTNKHEIIYIDNNRVQDSIFCLTTESKHVFASSFGTTTLCGFLPSQPSLSRFFYP